MAKLTFGHRGHRIWDVLGYDLLVKVRHSNINHKQIFARAKHFVSSINCRMSCRTIPLRNLNHRNLLMNTISSYYVVTYRK